MDDFETISLENKECKICKQETDEELIPCILREKFSSADRQRITFLQPVSVKRRLRTADCGLQTADQG